MLAKNRYLRYQYSRLTQTPMFKTQSQNCYRTSSAIAKHHNRYNTAQTHKEKRCTILVHYNTSRKISANITSTNIKEQALRTMKQKIYMSKNVTKLSIEAVQGQ